MGCLASERIARIRTTSPVPPCGLSFFLRMRMPVGFTAKETSSKAGPRNRPTTHNEDVQIFHKPEKRTAAHTRLDTRAQGTQRAGQKVRDKPVRTGKSFSSFRTVAYLFQYVRPFGLEPEQVGFVDRSFILSLSLSIMNPARFSTRKITERRTGQPAATIVTSTAGRRIR